MENDMIRYLFDTAAIRVCPENKPFWYTSGRIGPFYVNTHFLYGSEKKANDLLAYIDEVTANPMECSKLLLERMMNNYEQDSIFRGTIDYLVEQIRSHVPLDEVSFISGGERRDWFFSLPVAQILGLPHLTLFKDNSAVMFAVKSGTEILGAGRIDAGCSAKVERLDNQNGLHIADLITTASSYARNWVPAVRSLGGNLLWSYVIVDRLQGGGKVIEDLGMKSYCLAEISKDVFISANNAAYIDNEQLKMVLDYIEEPDGSMNAFLGEHPEFLKETLASGGKNAERAKMCMENVLYKNVENRFEKG